MRFSNQHSAYWQVGEHWLWDLPNRGQCPGQVGKSTQAGTTCKSKPKGGMWEHRAVTVMELSPINWNLFARGSAIWGKHWETTEWLQGYCGSCDHVQCRNYGNPAWILNDGCGLVALGSYRMSCWEAAMWLSDDNLSLWNQLLQNA